MYFVTVASRVESSRETISENGARTNVSVVGLGPPAVNTELRRQIFPAGNEAETETVEPVADHFVDCLLPARRLDLHGSIVDLS